jgi:hypothetical protein
VNPNVSVDSHRTCMSDRLAINSPEQGNSPLCFETRLHCGTIQLQTDLPSDSFLPILSPVYVISQPLDADHPHLSDRKSTMGPNGAHKLARAFLLHELVQGSVLGIPTHRFDPSGMCGRLARLDL